MATKTTSLVLKIALPILLLVLIAGGGFFGYQHFSRNQQIPPNLPQVRLKADVLQFTQRTMPMLFGQLTLLDHTLTGLDLEIERLEGIAQEFPQQKKIIQSEAAGWRKLRREFNTVLGRLEKEIESLYVAYLVDPHKGLALMQEKQEPLVQEASQALEAARDKTQRLRPRQAPQTIIDKLKQRLFPS